MCASLLDCLRALCVLAHGHSHVLVHVVELYTPNEYREAVVQEIVPLPEKHFKCERHVPPSRGAGDFSY